MIGNPFVVKMIESTIDKTAREIKNNPTKGVKSLVGLANRHASSPVQKDLVASLQTMLGDPNSPLYRIIPALINDVHPKTFKTFIMNIAYNSWSYGGKKIKQYEKVYNINIPWTIVFDFTKETARPLNTHTILSVIEQGKKVGIYTYLFFINSMDNLPDVLEQNPDCAFMLYILPTTLTNENIAMIKSYHNTFFSVLYHPGINVEAFKKSINLLYNNHCLFGTHSYYNNENTNYILSNKWINETLTPKSPFLFLIESDSCTQANASLIHDYIDQLKINQGPPCFLVDLYEDMTKIDSQLSKESRLLKILGNGDTSCNSVNTPHNVTTTALLKILSTN